MGWTFGWDRRSLLIEHVTNAWTDGARTTRCIRRYFSGNDLWTVWETTGPNVPDDSRRFIVLFKMRRVGGDWGYKDETESVGPVRLTCPPAFFDLVPDPGGHATKWRANVRAYHAARSRHVEVGDLIARPGAGAAPLEVVRTRPLLVYNPSTDQTYRLSRAAFARTVTIGRTNAAQPGPNPEARSTRPASPAGANDCHGAPRQVRHRPPGGCDMKADVHIFAVVRIKVAAVEGTDDHECIDRAVESVNLN